LLVLAPQAPHFDCLRQVEDADPPHTPGLHPQAPLTRSASF
jgi:hypothetical protein